MAPLKQPQQQTSPRTPSLNIRKSAKIDQKFQITGPPKKLNLETKFGHKNHTAPPPSSPRKFCITFGHSFGRITSKIQEVEKGQNLDRKIRNFQLSATAQPKMLELKKWVSAESL